MKKYIYLLLTLLVALPLQAKKGDGHLFIIGGGDRPDSLMTQFVDLAGGQKKAKILIVPYASADINDTGSYQKEGFQRLGVKDVDYIHVEKKDIDTPEALKQLDGVTGIFFSGGDQNRLTQLLLGTKFLEKIKKIHADGGVIGGTSAGAAIMSKIMLTGEELNAPEKRKGDFSYIQKGNVEVTEGFGFVDNAIIDQHFVIRKRENRLLTLVLEKGLTGIGIDEATAIIVDTNGKFRVAGHSQVLVFEPKAPTEVTHTNHLKTKELTLRILTAGDEYQIK